MSSIFSLYARQKDKIILQVHATSPLAVAEHPYVSSDYAYITVTRGRDHILTVVKQNGSTFSFHWGYSGYTLISESLEVLRKKVIDFIENECGISLEWNDGVVNKATIYFNSNFQVWMAHLENSGEAFIKYPKARSVEDVKVALTPYLQDNNATWTPGIAVTGIKIWTYVR